MRRFPTAARGRPWTAARRFHGFVATWLQDRRRTRRALRTVTADDLTMYWAPIKTLYINLEVGGLDLSRFQSFQLRLRTSSPPGSWFNAGTKTVFSPTLLTWSAGAVTEGLDYVFELTVTEVVGTVTVTTDIVNIGFA